MSTDGKPFPKIADWTLAAVAMPGGACLSFVSPTEGIEALIALDRQQARTFAHAILAAAGDATFRTIPHPRDEAERG